MNSNGQKQQKATNQNVEATQNKVEEAQAKTSASAQGDGLRYDYDDPSGFDHER
ncbi:hypothetical protein [Desertibacillus haloalkaliphilus]|uniref:hypothetical protein n=1 Tax=Desertibacillus haloalkaliphilus TaxID=1328930 RepID=UPI001C2691B5|nr:hypothetical protein [Desertibacillus haloalkaliphilus]MBU8907632.1 hypothetical protein [Desertibacillus haloalkaliphilus]